MPRQIRVVCLVILLLSLLPGASARAQADDCAAAPPPRLAAGTMGRVITAGVGQAGVLRVRETPGATGRILVEMITDERFTVTGEAACADGYWWWPVVTAGGIRGWSAEGAAGSYFAEPILDPPPDSLPTPPERLLQSAGTGTPHTLAWRWDGMQLAVGTSLGAVLYAPLLEAQQSLPGPDTIALAWRPDGQVLAGGGADGTLTFWALPGGERRTYGAHSGPVLALAWSPDGTRLASTSAEARVRVWDAASGAPLASLELPGTASALAWSPDGAWITVGSALDTDPSEPQNFVQLWDAATYTLAAEPPEIAEVLYSPGVGWLGWSPNGRQLAIDNGCNLGFLWVWDPAAGAITGSEDPVALDTCVVAADWLPDGSGLVWAVSYYGSGALNRSGRDEPLALNNVYLLDLAARPQGQEIALLSRDALVLVEDRQLGEVARASLDAPAAEIAWEGEATSPALVQPRLNAADIDLYAGETLQATLNVESACGMLRELRSATIAPDGSLIAVVALTPEEAAWESPHTCLTLWRVADGAFAGFINPPPTYSAGGNGITLYMDYFIQSLTWTPDSRRLYARVITDVSGPAALSGYGGFYLWDTAGSLIFWMTSDPARVYNFATAWSPDWSRLAILNSDTLQVWDAATLQLAAGAGVDAQDVGPDLAWSPDGTRLAGSDAAFDVVIWDAASGRTLHYLSAHTDHLTGLAWSPDGTRLASASTDLTIRVWDVTRARLLMTLPVSSAAYSLAWNAEGSRLLSESRDHVRQVWNVE